MSGTVGANFSKVAGSPTMRTSGVTERAVSRARASSVCPRNSTNALSAPMRVLLPPARIKTTRSEIAGIGGNDTGLRRRFQNEPGDKALSRRDNGYAAHESELSRLNNRNLKGYEGARSNLTMSSFARPDSRGRLSPHEVGRNQSPGDSRQNYETIHRVSISGHVIYEVRQGV